MTDGWLRQGNDEPTASVLSKIRLLKRQKDGDVKETQELTQNN